MSDRAEALAAQFEAANNDLIGTVQVCPQETWLSACPSDGRSVGVVAHHVAVSYGPISAIVRSVALGESSAPNSMEMIDQSNAVHAVQFANVSQTEAIDALRENGAAAATMVRGFTDDQLAKTRSMMGSDWTAAQVIERILIGHITNHLSAIRAA